ncbi:hypothetical protein EVAR_26412_1 [Eumeta japonica]|uniref:Uncharacterized protein n=1 Tax=Eumeta variegata TaxID=151549 RepID=A0A4C1VRE7_EUMVA|nr:hypothetical protein EVAR_26412_1 [Eumeta japonica]
MIQCAGVTLPVPSLLRHCDAFVTNFTAAKGRYGHSILFVSVANTDGFTVASAIITTHSRAGGRRQTEASIPRSSGKREL